jgi:hypothetical protein
MNGEPGGFFHSAMGGWAAFKSVHTPLPVKLYGTVVRILASREEIAGRTNRSVAT